MAQALEQTNINPWVRANLGIECDETRALMPSEKQEDYSRVMRELGAASTALMEAQERYRAALAAQHALFKGLAYE